jgi:hypothetical protein
MSRLGLLWVIAMARFDVVGLGGHGPPRVQVAVKVCPGGGDDLGIPVEGLLSAALAGAGDVVVAIDLTV